LRLLVRRAAAAAAGPSAAPDRKALARLRRYGDGAAFGARLRAGAGMDIAHALRRSADSC